MKPTKLIKLLEQEGINFSEISMYQFQIKYQGQTIDIWPTTNGICISPLTDKRYDIEGLSTFINFIKHGYPIEALAKGFLKTKGKKRGRLKKRILYHTSARCYICNKFLAFDEVTLDHVIPVSKGGTNKITNLKVCCFQCNQEKADKILQFSDP